MVNPCFALYKKKLCFLFNDTLPGHSIIYPSIMKKTTKIKIFKKFKKKIKPN